MRKFFMVLSSCLLLCGCKALVDEVASYEHYVMQVTFSQGSYSVYKGGFTGCYVTVKPDDSFSYYDSEFEIVNGKVARISRSSEGYCLVEGVSVGSTILKCTVSNKSCETVINVVENK